MRAYRQEKNGSYFKSRFNPTIHPSNLKFNYLRIKMQKFQLKNSNLGWMVGWLEKDSSIDTREPPVLEADHLGGLAPDALDDLRQSRRHVLHREAEVHAAPVDPVALVEHQRDVRLRGVDEALCPEVVTLERVGGDLCRAAAVVLFLQHERRHALRCGQQAEHVSPVAEVSGEEREIVVLEVHEVVAMVHRGIPLRVVDVAEGGGAKALVGVSDDDLVDHAVRAAEVARVAGGQLGSFDAVLHEHVIEDRDLEALGLDLLLVGVHAVLIIMNIINDHLGLHLIDSEVAACLVFFVPSTVGLVCEVDLDGELVLHTVERELDLLTHPSKF